MSYWRMGVRPGATRTLRKAAHYWWAPAIGVSGVDPEYVNDPGSSSMLRKGCFPALQTQVVPRGCPYGAIPFFSKNTLEVFVQEHANNLPKGWESDLETIGTPIDFCGQNIYAAWGYHTRMPAANLNIFTV